MNPQIKTFLLFLFLCGYAFSITSCNNENKTRNNTIRVPGDSVTAKEILNPYAKTDLSPMDLSYFPTDYPVLKMNGKASGEPVARVIYSRPPKRGRAIFGDAEKSLRPYGKEWRLGANEATEIEFFIPVMIDGKKINKGRYIMYCFPYPNIWTIILNNNLYSWGLHMDSGKDILRCTIPVQEQSPVIEDFTMVFEKSDQGANLVMAWDNVKAVLPIVFTK